MLCLVSDRDIRGTFVEQFIPFFDFIKQILIFKSVSRISEGPIFSDKHIFFEYTANSSELCIVKIWRL